MIYIKVFVKYVKFVNFYIKLNKDFCLIKKKTDML